MTIKSDLLEYWATRPNLELTGPEALDFYCNHPLFGGQKEYASMNVYRILRQYRIGVRHDRPQVHIMGLLMKKNVLQENEWNDSGNQIRKFDSRNLNTTMGHVRKRTWRERTGYNPSTGLFENNKIKQVRVEQVQDNRVPTPKPRTITVEIPPATPDEVSMDGQVLELAGRKYRLTEIV